MTKKKKKNKKLKMIFTCPKKMSFKTFMIKKNFMILVLIVQRNSSIVFIYRLRFKVILNLKF